MNTMATTLAMLAVALGASAFGQETAIQVPQGSGVFPTVGQVNCLEELGSGRLCAATYECSGESGRLWGDLANHDGRRAIGGDSPVARGRDCVVTVDGKAAVRWLTGYSPDGRNGELVGLTTSAEALRPVQSVRWQTVEGGSLLEYVLELHNTSLRELVEQECYGGNRNPAEGDRDCFWRVMGPAVRGLNLPDDTLGRCVVDATEAAAAERDESAAGVEVLRGVTRWPLPHDLAGYEVELYAECLPLMREKAAAHGLEYRAGGGPGALELYLAP